MIRRYLVNDMVVMEDVCNASCEYCLTSSSDFKDKHNLDKVDNKLKFRLEKLKLLENQYTEGSRLYIALNRLIDRVDKSVNPYILKLSGGEIFLIKGIERFFEEVSKRYTRIQILTNGTRLNDNTIEMLSKIKNLSLQISLDGDTVDKNRYRSSSEVTLNQIKNAIKKCSQAGINIEINCVLTDINIEGLYSFAEYLCKLEHVLFLPYPVRGPLAKHYLPHKSQLSDFRKLIEDYERFYRILPPKAYLQELLEYLETGIISCSCLIPNVMLQSFDDGIVTPCPNIWFMSLGNILDSTKDVDNGLRRGQLSNIVRRKRSKLKECTNCFTPWELVNLYLKHKISDEELARIYLYNDRDILKFLSDKKREIGFKDE